MQLLALETKPSRYATVAVLLAASAACSRVVDASKGDTSESADSASTAQPFEAGVDAASTAIGVHDAGLARFRATLEGDVVNVVALDRVWLEGCQTNPQLVQKLGDSWVPLRDERPEAFNLHHAAHYLDGTLYSDCYLSLGCDVASCQAFPEEALSEDQLSDLYAPLIAREYIEVAQLGAPSCERQGRDSHMDAGGDAGAGSDAGVRLIPSLDSRVPSGPLGVRIRYYRDSGCRTEALTTEIAVE
jgi:hypothetical protein